MMYLFDAMGRAYDPFLKEKQKRLKKHIATCKKNKAKRKAKKRR